MTTLEQLRNGSDPTYLFSRNEAESRRLMLQSRLLNPITEWILRQAGIAEGMTVLDVGSGAGDVDLLAADLVGSNGTVVGVDVNSEGLELARARANQAGMTNVEFVTGDCRTVDLDDGFDAIVGRCVLLYVSDPVAMLRSLVERLAPGGIVAFQKVNMTPDHVLSWPPLPIWQRWVAWVRAAGRQAGLNPAMGYQLWQTFIDAGLPEPRMQFDAPLGGGPNWDGYDWHAATLRSMLPLVLKSGIATAEEVDIDTLGDRLCAETIAAGGVVKGPDLVSAWTRKRFPMGDTRPGG